jgi:membrane-bound serine protease (ClpP class)
MRALLMFLCICTLLPWPHLSASEQPTTSATIVHLTVDASINPVVADFISEQIDLANSRQLRAVLVQLSTPGGLDSAMRQIIQAELNSQIPIIVYIAPAGARAASAGALITLAADFAAMAPGTNIGAAHPVSIGPGSQPSDTMNEKIVNDAAAYARSLAQQRGRNQEWAEAAVRDSISASAQEALDEQVIDLIAENAKLLLEQLDGLNYRRLDQSYSLQTADAQLRPVSMTWRQEILSALSNPTFAYLLMMLGILGIFFEISQPGVIFPGVIGTISILLAFFAFSMLPINYVGLLLILLAAVLFILEVKVLSYGMLTVGGIISMAIGSLMLIDSSEPYLQISRAVIAATIAVSAGFMIFAGWMVVRTQNRPLKFGQEGMIGEQGEVIDAIDGDGRVFVHGEYWRATAAQPLPVGSRIEVLQIRDGLILEVQPVDSVSGSETEKEH